MKWQTSWSLNGKLMMDRGRRSYNVKFHWICLFSCNKDRRLRFCERRKYSNLLCNHHPSLSIEIEIGHWPNDKDFFFLTDWLLKKKKKNLMRFSLDSTCNKVKIKQTRKKEKKKRTGHWTVYWWKLLSNFVLFRKWNDRCSCFSALVTQKRKRKKVFFFCQKMALSVGNLTEETTRRRKSSQC